jgi:hypothetical protein
VKTRKRNKKNSETENWNVIFSKTERNGTEKFRNGTKINLESRETKRKSIKTSFGNVKNLNFIFRFFKVSGFCLFFTSFELT